MGSLRVLLYLHFRRGLSSPSFYGRFLLGLLRFTLVFFVVPGVFGILGSLSTGTGRP